MNTKLCVIGSSGFAREVIDVAIDIGYRDFLFADGQAEIRNVAGFSVINDSLDVLTDLSSQGWKFSIGIGSPDVRRRVAKRLDMLSFQSLIHPSATFGFGQRAALVNSEGLFIAAGVRLQNSIVLGKHCILSLNVTVGHDSIFDDYVSVMPGANISGNVHIEEGAYIGTGSAIIHGGNDKKLVVGKDAVIGAGAVVTRNIPAGVTAVGVPAKPRQ